MPFSFSQPASTASSSTPASAPFSFGGANATQKAPASTPSFTFDTVGQAQQRPALGGMFQGTGNQAQQQQQQSNAGITFGANNQQQSNTGGLFGGAANNQQQQQQGGGFGSSLFGSTGQQQPQQQQQSSSLFGTSIGNHNTRSPLFGSSQQQQPQQQNTFGLNQAAGSSNPLTLSQLNSQPSYQQQQNKSLQQSTGFLGGAGGSTSGTSGKDNNTQKRLGIPVNDKLEALRAAWDVRDIQSCRFLFYFYNSLPQQPSVAEASLSNPNFGRRADATGPRHDEMWLQTLRENPDRSRLVPILAVGFPEVKARLEMQQAETQRQSGLLTELRKRLEDLTSKHTLSNSVRIAAISRKQTSLHHRLISVARKIHLLIPALRGQSVTIKEEQLKSILQNCEMELESISLGIDGRPSSGNGGTNNNYTVRLRGRINELWALLGNVKAKREATMASEGNTNQLEWAVVDESALEDVAKILSSQQQGLDHLSTTLQSDTKALDIITKGLEGVELTGTK